MPTTLSRLFPFSRLAPLRRVPFRGLALALCALFAVAGVAALDDYGITWDETNQREIAGANAEYIATGSAERLYHRDYRYYGVAFEMPLLLIERALGLQDSRRIYLTRHLLTHLFFIAGGFVCGLLAYRMMGSRWIALFAMLLFLLHPRLYAHSFFNTKDIPFAVALIITLYIAHRAFRKDTLGAFLLCGIGVGLAINLRPFGLMLLPMLLAMRALDLWQADREERKRILAYAGIFAAAALATAWIAHPHYWENPLRFVEGLRVFSQHPTIAPNLFMGEIHWSYDVPWNFIPVWFAITAPPVALLLGAIGCAAACWQGISRPFAALRDREIRFRILLLGCFALPVAAVIALQSNTYNGWRHMYFLWAPFCLLAAIGLHHIANIRINGDVGKIGARLPRWVHGGGRLHTARRALAYSVVGGGLITTLTAMAGLHPHQQVYFNALVDTKTPDALAERYDMDYWRVAQLQLLERLSASYPDDTLRVWPATVNARILPQNDRERVTDRHNLHAADFYPWPDIDFFLTAPNPQEAGFYHPLIDPRLITDRPPIHSVKAYDSPIALIFGKDTDAYRAAYEDIATNGDLIARADFDIYAYHDALYYLSDNCLPPAPSRADLRIFLHITPDNPADLPADRVEHGFENRDFRLSEHAAFFDGKCVNRQPLPDYSIARIATGVYVEGKAVWRADVNLAARAAAQAVYDGIVAGDYGAPVAQSDFDVYLSGNALTYLKERCAEGDAEARFFLHIIPADPADLPADRRESGFANMDFWFAEHGADIGGKCVATPELPNYAIERVRTGQFVSGEGSLWRADIDLAAQVVYDRIAAGDYGQPIAQSDFDLYLSGNALTYIKENCAAGDTDARFFLHIFPADVADLPADRRERGFANLDFWFGDHGARIGDICVVERKLPAYAIASISTGQFVSEEGAVWRVEFAAGQ